MKSFHYGAAAGVFISRVVRNSIFCTKAGQVFDVRADILDGGGDLMIFVPEEDRIELLHVVYSIAGDDDGTDGI